MATAQPAPTKSTSLTGVLIGLVVGAGICIAVGVYSALHEPGTVAINVAGFSSFLAVKAWLTTVAFVLAIAQVVSALMIYGKIPGGGPAVVFTHRWSGRAALLASIPVAAHCMYTAGFQATDTRVLLHSLAGTFFYGVFALKMVVLARDDSPGWALPVAGAAVFTGLTALWLTASLWFFTEFGVTF